MAKDIYYWRMNAKAHQKSIRMLTKEIIDAYRSQTPLPISLITDLLPLQTDQVSDIIARGNIIITQDDFINEADDELWIEFYDPVIEEFSVTVPTIWTGSLKNENNILTINFEPPLEIEIQRLSDLGINRSAYQILGSIQISSAISISKFIDANDPEKETWIQAEFDDVENIDMTYFDLHNIKDSTDTFGERMINPLTSLLSKENNSGCGPDPGDPEWYVYEKQGTCITHHGTMMGSNGYNVVYGPTTQADCGNWIYNNCHICHLMCD